MTKLNPSVKNQVTERTAGGMGAPAAKQSPEEQLRRLTLANMLFEDNAYVDGQSVADSIKKLIPKVDPQKVADLAIEIREKQFLRHTPLFIASEMCHHPKHNQLVATVLEKICTRPDMITDFIALYKKEREEGNQTLTKQARKGLSAAFLKFNEYQLSKYKTPTSQYTLKGAMRHLHVKPQTKEQAELFGKLMKDTLEIPLTWETELSAGKDKKETFTKLIKEKKLGPMALMKNLRNMQDARVNVELVVKAIQESSGKMLTPIDYLKAKENLSSKWYAKLRPHLELSILKSLSALPKIEGRTLLIIDTSGSMNQPISARSKFTRLDIAKALAMTAKEVCEDVDIWTTASNHLKVKKTAVRGLALLDEIQNLVKKGGYDGIYTRRCLEYIRNMEQEDYDRIIVFSDSQDCDRSGEKPEPFGTYNYVVDVSAHKQGINYEGVWTAEISGWSSQFLNFIAAYEGFSLATEES